MTARDDILAAVRRALADADPTPVAVARAYRDTPPPPDPVALFVERAAEYRAHVVRCAEADIPAIVAAAVGPAARVLLPPGFPYPVAGQVDAGETAAQLDGFDAVVTTAALAIATTGTLVLDHGPGQGRRALTLVPDTHFCLVRADQVVADVPAAVAALDPARPQTWISGPSATSDIELTRVEGVHGPRTLHILVVDPA
ncbi:LutC/YkgG family protein [Actinokineospora sp. G85]|uniref:LutC/YkgG family protein n=1 Tax=Actinokineospora sp. G85 TaxID=3406626 RepID=UPI003C70E66A